MSVTQLTTSLTMKPYRDGFEFGSKFQPEDENPCPPNHDASYEDRLWWAGFSSALRWRISGSSKGATQTRLKFIRLSQTA